MVFKTICVGSIPAIFVIISYYPKTNKFKLSISSYKPNYLKLYKRIKLNFYKINKFTTNINKLKIKLNYQSNQKKQHSLLLSKHK